MFFVFFCLFSQFTIFINILSARTSFFFFFSYMVVSRRYVLGEQIELEHKKLLEIPVRSAPIASSQRVLSLISVVSIWEHQIHRSIGTSWNCRTISHLVRWRSELRTEPGRVLDKGHCKFFMLRPFFPHLVQVKRPKQWTIDYTSLLFCDRKSRKWPRRIIFWFRGCQKDLWRLSSVLIGAKWKWRWF